MKKLLLLFVLLLSFSVSAQNNEHKKDSLRNAIQHSKGEGKKDAYLALASIYRNDARYDEQKRDVLFVFYREMEVEAERVGDEQLCELILSSEITDLYNFEMYDEVIRLVPEYMKILENKQLWNCYYRLYRLFCDSYLLKSNENEALALTQKMYEYAKAREHNQGMSLAFFEMSRIYGAKRRFDEEEKSLRECIRLVQNSTSSFGILVDAHANLSYNLIAQKKYDDAIQVAGEMGKYIKIGEEYDKRQDANSWRRQWVIYLDAYRQAGDWEHAEIYCNKIDSITNGKYNLYEAKAFIALSKKKYTEALELIDKAIEIAPPLVQLSPRASKLSIYLQAQGQNGVEMDSLYKDVLNRLEEQHNEQMTAQLDELRTEYEVEKIQSEKKKLRSYMFFAFGICLLLLIILAVYTYFYQLIRKKNLALFRQIKEQDNLTEQLKQIEQQYEMQTEDAPSLQGTRHQRQLVAHFNEYLQKDNHYIDSEIDIDHIIPILATNRAYFFEAIKEVTKKTPMEYIRSLQLEEAKKMLENNFELTIESIAGDCGFNSRNTFYRLFREQYQITPKEYRKMVKYSL